ncbi:MAG: RtcB family protein, partial [bacterium]
MPSKKDFQQISQYVWEIPPSFRSDMRVPARIYGSEEILEKCLEDDSINQLINMTALPGIVNYALAMPDAHQGYGFPIGGV